MPLDLSIARPGRVERLTLDRAVVIGDLHGRLDLLDRLLALLPDDLPIVCCGDLGDRGPDTKGVLDRLIARGARSVRGNHDEWLADWANGRGFDVLALSPKMGGDATLRSYGVEGRTPAEVEAQASRVPESHRAFLDALPIALDLQVGGERWWVVHAGVPATESFAGLTAEAVVPHLATHRPATLLWPSTDPASMVPVDRPVVMGHRTVREPMDLGFVVALDTGCGLPDGRLTGLVLPERRFVTVG